jgi:hypothetical protein
MLSSILPRTFSNTLLIALDGTLLSLLDICSQARSQDAPKHTVSTLPSTPPSTFSSTLLGILSRTLPIALEGTLSACMTVRFQVSSQDTPKSTSESLSITLPIALDGTLLAYLALYSQVHSQEGRYSQSHLPICSHVCSRMLNAATC